MTICLDPGHGMSNRKLRLYDPGATNGDVNEATIVMSWANVLREILMTRGHRVIRTRKDAGDPAPVGQRAGIAKEYGCEIMLSLHCNAADGKANGTETFYRGEANAVKAREINDAVVKVLGTRDRGIKTEAESQHKRLAVMSFQPCFLLEIGFIDHDGDMTKMMSPKLREAACRALADVLTSTAPKKA